MASIDLATSDRYRHRRLPAGTLLCREGDFGDTMYLVTEGSLQISKRLIEGAEKVIASLGVGQYVGELSLLTGAQRSATMRATVDTEVIEIDQEAFMQLLHDQPQIGLELMQQMARRIHETTEALILTELEIALAQRGPRRAKPGSRRMRFIATGSFSSDKTAEVVRLAAERLPLAHNPGLHTSLIRPGRTQDALLYILETDDPRDLLVLIAPFIGLVQWDISPAIDIDEAIAPTPS
ncbi:MAG: cyclic nucleotide-binding domain-containing protein [Candidatus Tectimicrobiota bacterium]